MATRDVLAYLAGIVVTIAIAIPLKRALLRGSPKLRTTAILVVIGVLAIAVAVQLLT